MAMIQKHKKTLTIYLTICLCIICLCFGLCGCNISGFSGSSDTQAAGITSEEFILENSDGTYTFGEIVSPDDYKKVSHPLVVMSHGIYGSMNSGGARQLSEMLAEAGIAAVRVDFNRCKTDDLAAAESREKSDRTNEYTISDMMESNLLAIDFALSNYNVDKDRIGQYGRSFGGRVAMTMANESWGGIDYKALALIAPAGNEYALIHYMGGQKVWDEMKAAAESKDVYDRNGLKLTPKWFEDYYKYDPSKTGYKFGDKPVMVYYNTKDTVVEPKTSKDCAHAYSNVKIYKVTTDDGHGYEMAYKDSKIKDEIMNRVVKFFSKNL